MNTPTPARAAELNKAADQWRQFKSDPTCNAALAKACENAAISLEMEASDGIGRCACHLLPFAECRQLATRSRR